MMMNIWRDLLTECIELLNQVSRRFLTFNWTMWACQNGVTWHTYHHKQESESEGMRFQCLTTGVQVVAYKLPLE